MYFVDEKKNAVHGFELTGDQWMIEGYFLRWGLPLRWLGARAHYRVTRFSSRWIKPNGKKPSLYPIYPEGKIWQFLLKHGKNIPGIEAAYGIAAFQYPQPDTIQIFINDTGFILRTQ